MNSSFIGDHITSPPPAFKLPEDGQACQYCNSPTSASWMLNYFYRVAFDATAAIRVTIFGEANAMVEADFIGKHIGEFAGIPATGRTVHVPLCVVYDLDHDQITRGRVYFEMPALLQQLGVG